MKKSFILSLVAAMFVAVMTTSCSMQSMTFKNLEKKGYTVGQLTPAQQQEIAPLLSAFPALNLTAEAYIASTYTITFMYEATSADWATYGNALKGAGFSAVANGYVKADKNAGITYNVSAKTAELSKKTYLIVTFTSKTM